MTGSPADRPDDMPDEVDDDRQDRDDGFSDSDVRSPDSPGESADSGDEFDDPPIYESSGSGLHARDVEVPMRVYKTVTVFSTLIAVVCVVAGFVVLDRATDRASLPLSQVDPVLAFLGIAVILFGAATYAFATRFRAAGMGSSKNDDDEPADNG